MKGMTTCKVCGRDFALMAEEHYIVQDPRRVGVLANPTNTDKAMEYDAFDCPHCGCQNVVQERKPLWMPEACDCTESEEEDTDSESEVSEEDSEDSVSTEHMREYLEGSVMASGVLSVRLTKRGSYVEEDILLGPLPGQMGT